MFVLKKHRTLERLEQKFKVPHKTPPKQNKIKNMLKILKDVWSSTTKNKTKQKEKLLNGPELDPLERRRTSHPWPQRRVKKIGPKGPQWDWSIVGWLWTWLLHKFVELDYFRRWETTT